MSTLNPRYCGENAWRDWIRTGFRLFVRTQWTVGMPLLMAALVGGYFLNRFDTRVAWLEACIFGLICALMTMVHFFVFAALNAAGEERSIGSSLATFARERWIYLIRCGATRLLINILALFAIALLGAWLGGSSPSGFRWFGSWTDLARAALGVAFVSTALERLDLLSFHMQLGVHGIDGAAGSLATRRGIRLNKKSCSKIELAAIGVAWALLFVAPTLGLFLYPAWKCIANQAYHDIFHGGRKIRVAQKATSPGSAKVAHGAALAKSQ